MVSWSWEGSGAGHTSRLVSFALTVGKQLTVEPHVSESVLNECEEIDQLVAVQGRNVCTSWGALV